MRKFSKLSYYILAGLLAFVLCFAPMQNVLADKAQEPDSELSVPDNEEEPDSEQKDQDEEEPDSEQKDLDEEEPDSEQKDLDEEEPDSEQKDPDEEEPDSEQKDLDEEEPDSEKKDLDEEEPDSEVDSESEPKRNLLTNEGQGQGPEHYTFSYLNKDGETVEAEGVKLSELMEKTQTEAAAAGDTRPCVLDDPSSNSSEIFVLADGNIYQGNYQNVSGLQIPESKTVNLVLADNCLLECWFIELLEGTSPSYTTFCIYAQSDGYNMGQLDVETGDRYPAASAIGCAAAVTRGNVCIYGGKIRAISENGAGIGTPYIDDGNYGCEVKIFGGNVYASSGNNAGIQGGCSSVEIYGGTVEAYSMDSSAINSMSNVALYGGNVSANTGSSEESGGYAIKAKSLMLASFLNTKPSDFSKFKVKLESIDERNIYAEKYYIDSEYKCTLSNADPDKVIFITENNASELLNDQNRCVIVPLQMGVKKYSVTLDSGKIYLNFFVYCPGGLRRKYDLSGSSFRYWVNGYNSLAHSATIDGNTMAGSQVTDDGIYYNKVSVEIQSVEMADEVIYDFSLKDKEGYTEGKQSVYSLMDYYSDLLKTYDEICNDPEVDEEVKQKYLSALQLLRSLAEYGKEEQTFLMDYHDWTIDKGDAPDPGHKAIVIPNGAPGTPYDVDKAKSELGSYPLTITGSSENIIRSNISVAFESDLSMRIKVDLKDGVDKDSIKESVSVTKAGKSAEGVTITTTDTGLQIIVPGISLQNADQYYDVTVDGKTYRACPLAYANAIMGASNSYEGDKNPHAKNAMAAFYNAYTKAHAWVYPNN